MSNKFAFIKQNKKLVKLKFDDILAIKGLGNYVEIFTKTGEKHIYYKSLKELIAKLPDEFMRVHNSHIVNLTNIDLLEDNYVISQDVKIPVARSYRDCLNSRVEKLML